MQFDAVPEFGRQTADTAGAKFFQILKWQWTSYSQHDRNEIDRVNREFLGSEIVSHFFL